MIDASNPAPPAPPISLRHRWYLAFILLLALAARVTYVIYTSRGSNIEIIDVDGYMAQGQLLAGQGQGWHWDVQAITYRRSVKAPLYPVLLSAVALVAPARLYPALAVFAHIAAAVISVGLIFWLGRTIHSDRAGLLAAGIYALWHPDVTAVTTFIQEHFWIPLTLAGFAFFLRGAARNGPLRDFAAAGVMLGLAALVRSMPVYYLPVGVLAYVVSERGRRMAFRRAAVLVAAFALTIGPYCIYISSELHEVVLIDNQGTHMIETGPAPTKPSVFQGAGLIVSRFVGSPGEFIAARAPLLPALFQCRGGRWLETDGLAQTRGGATALKIVTHATNDLPYCLVILSAPIGFVVARRRREALLLVLWIALNVGLMNLFFWSGARYRQAFMPELIVLAGVALAGAWQRPSRLAGFAAIGTSVAAAWLVLPSLPQSLRGRAEYGVARWSIASDLRSTRSTRRAGFNLVPKAGRLVFDLQSLRAPLQLTVKLQDRPAAVVQLENRTWKELSYPWPGSDPIVFVELAVSDPPRRGPLLLSIRTTSVAR